MFIMHIEAVIILLMFQRVIKQPVPFPEIADSVVHPPGIFKKAFVI